MSEIVDIPALGAYSNFSGYGYCDGAGTTVPPNGALGWSYGAIFRHLDGSGAADAVYINIGDEASANFDPVYPTSWTGSGNYEIPMTHWRVWDAVATNLPGTAANDDLGLETGTWLSAPAPQIVSVDFGGVTTTAYARLLTSLPMDWVPGTDVVFNVVAAMEEVADTSATIDIEATCPTGSPADDFCATDAQSINNQGAAIKSFTISSGAFGNAGDSLDIRMKFAGTDAGDAAPNIRALITAAALSYTRYI